QNYPNPFNPTTTIGYALPVGAEVTLTIYNVSGQQVRTFDRGHRAAGRYAIEWDGTADDGSAVATGVYLYKITAGDFTSTRKMLLVK
ncbi:T9SS type A sorting domain-containing protein, partial [candidate division GN15 bacterium]|nr:T9SS type A sorting domain-containing protein [candidate division GN15 bacterium]